MSFRSCSEKNNVALASRPCEALLAQGKGIRVPHSGQVSALARYHSSRVNYAAAIGRAGEFSL